MSCITLDLSRRRPRREDFFKGAGEVIDIRFSSDAEGMFKGFGHVEFATAEEAQKVSFHLLVQFTASRDL
ncbi:hypothetical protein L1049_017390 [Liquidambar formosana]|uniref:RRM domain-containing protein n=1 Tax=Liquidambar formosana TaxID=63359 RepID=A0AAP0S8F8_LIQFO